MRYVCILVIVIIVSACNKLLDTEPDTERVSSETVYASNATAIAVLNGVYSSMSAGDVISGSKGISYLAGLSADELTLLNFDDPKQLAVYRNDLLPGDVECWNNLYNYIYQANAAIIGLQHGKTDKDVQRQLTGEALFVRAFCYFYLVNLYGDVPLVLGTDYKVNAVLPRTTEEKVYEQIIADLQTAAQLLSMQFLQADLKKETTARVRPTKWAARALLARVYLYRKAYGRAVQEIDTILERKEMFDTVVLDYVFLKNSTEAIWQLEPKKNRFTEDGFWFAVKKPAACSEMLLGALESGDKRKKSWMLLNNSQYYPFKYKSTTGEENAVEYLMMLRVGELYLNRAEAKYNTGDVNGALSDLNVIRVRAGLKKLKVITGEVIAHERQVELFSEWGHRWFDLKRTAHLDEVMDTVGWKKGNRWQTYQQLYPLAKSEIEANPNLKQNAGY